jgi:hypothetical protein
MGGNRQMAKNGWQAKKILLINNCFNILCLFVANG